MKKFIYIIICLFSISCNLYTHSQPSKKEKISVSAKALNKTFKEIRFTVRDLKPTKKEIEERIAYHKKCLDEYAPDFCEHLDPKKHQIRFEGALYCHHTKKDNQSPYDKNLKAKLYDKKGNVLAENYLKCLKSLDGSENCHKQIAPYFNFYLPYSKKAHKVKVIEIKEGKELTLNERNLLSYDEVLKYYDLSKETNCHHIQIAPTR